MVDRIQLILKVLNLTASRFADEIGVQRSAISHILSGRNMPSLDLIQKILRRYPDISSDWLLSGSGSMHKTAQPDLFAMESQVVKQETPAEMEKMTVVETIAENDSNVQENKPIDMSEPIQKVPEIFVKEDIKQEIPEIREQISLKNESETEKKSGKRIEKIVIFYSDQTFREYFPE